MEYIEALDFEKNIAANYNTIQYPTLGKTYLRLSCTIYSGYISVRWYDTNGDLLTSETINPNQETVNFKSVKIKSPRFDLHFSISSPAYIRCQAFIL